VGSIVDKAKLRALYRNLGKLQKRCGVCCKWKPVFSAREQIVRRNA
jgi:hypothetical protein